MEWSLRRGNPLGALWGFPRLNKWCVTYETAPDSGNTTAGDTVTKLHATRSLQSVSPTSPLLSVTVMVSAENWTGFVPSAVFQPSTGLKSSKLVF